MRTTLHVQNLKCGGCEHTIVNRLSEIVGVYDIDVDLVEETVGFTYNTPHDFEKAKHLLSRIGYPILGADNNLKAESQS
ncbi:heavy-metal-associated domain-containing protein [Lacinutrix sp. Bg11-31]|uniref:heavy-metal-associated domain-containing protein n=1 Tax=Lacinutrix sp. Bg11-31 TaxID=2057808 RepID=UPI000C309434|nr:heavy metal-associated domain-containing protein [Lacinutrix sp. Bg11-31]AUC81137.1 heavy metal transporter [Lacinutrix sp. Bg11-31]